MNTQLSAPVVSIPSAAVLGKHLRAARQKKGLTQRELAKQLYCSLRWVTEVENGKDTAQIGKVLALCQFLELDVLLAKTNLSFDSTSGTVCEDGNSFGGNHDKAADYDDTSQSDYPDLDTIMGRLS